MVKRWWLLTLKSQKELKNHMTTESLICILIAVLLFVVPVSKVINTILRIIGVITLIAGLGITALEIIKIVLEKKSKKNEIGIPCSNCPCVSAKTGLNIEDCLEAIVNHIPSPKGDDSNPLQALIFDSYYDSYKVLLLMLELKKELLK